jgi:hypothetical protein
MPKGKHMRFIFPGLREYGWYHYHMLADLNSVFKADIVYFNGGLHLLHLAPALPWGSGHRHIWEDAEHILGQFLDFVWAMTPKIMMMANHAVCEEDFTGLWKDMIDLLHQNPQHAASLCVDSVWEESLHMCSLDQSYCHFPLNDTIFDECARSTLTHHGMMILNGRLNVVWDKWVLDHQEKGGVFRINDAFGITDHKCLMSKDGRHYLNFVDSEIRNLLQFVKDSYT